MSDLENVGNYLMVSSAKGMQKLLFYWWKLSYNFPIVHFTQKNFVVYLQNETILKTILNTQFEIL